MGISRVNCKWSDLIGRATFQLGTTAHKYQTPFSRVFKGLGHELDIILQMLLLRVLHPTTYYSMQECAICNTTTYYVTTNHTHNDIHG